MADTIVLILTEQPGWRRMFEVWVIAAKIQDLDSSVYNKLLHLSQNIEQSEYNSQEMSLSRLPEGIMDTESCDLKEGWKHITWNDLKELTLNNHCIVMTI